MTDLIQNISANDTETMSSWRTFLLSVSCRAMYSVASWASGCGKTTPLRIILGLEQPDHGTIQGQVRPVSAVFQENRLFEDFSALSNAAVVCPKGDRQEAARHLTALGLADSLSLPVRALSGGMKRRVSIARAVLAPGPLLVLDEPFTGLDRTTKAVVLDYLKRYTQGRTLLLVTA